jgi:hypothetical protein
MAHTFEIRFARSAGFAAMLEAPSNSFRWTGSGRLSIDASGISVALKRGLSSLLIRNRMRRIPAANLKEVFREGESLRVEFATDKSARVSLQFWAHDRDTAAQIVSLLPTTRTFELEESAARKEFRINRHSATLLAAAVALAICGAMALRYNREIPSTGADSPVVAASAPARRAPLPAVEHDPASAQPVPAGNVGSAPAATPRASNAASPIDVPARPPVPLTLESLAATWWEYQSPSLAAPGSPSDVVGPAFSPARISPAGEGPVVPVPAGTSSWNFALRQLALFGSESDDLAAGFRADMDASFNRRITREEFLSRLATYEQGWWDVTFRILDSDEFSDPGLSDLRSTLLACARYQRHFLALYAEGVRANDQATIRRALAERARAGELDRRARRFID